MRYDHRLLRRLRPELKRLAAVKRSAAVSSQWCRHDLASNLKVSKKARNTRALTGVIVSPLPGLAILVFAGCSRPARAADGALG